ncbi:MAG: molybdopterin-dependent oxidoreductase [Deltaproteobacteria bacterium]|nr:molybdopterin-dependent oxidoreductase [Deltaproteobacteria bacterium]
MEENASDAGVDAIFPRVKGCIRRLRAKEVMYHPDRVNFPLKRAGERGEAKWEKISWEQAFDEIAEKLQSIKDKYGAEAAAGIKGTYRNKNFQTRFFSLFGSPNSTTQGKVCYGPLFAGREAGTASPGAIGSPAALPQNAFFCREQTPTRVGPGWRKPYVIARSQGAS